MTAEELLAIYRQRGDDAIGHELIDDATAFRFLTAAEREACLRAKLLYDDSSTFLALTLVADTGTYALDSRVHLIDSASMTLTSGGRPYDLRLVGIDWIRDQSDWQSRTGRPEVLAIIDRVARVWPTPLSGSVGTVQLRGYRFPLYPIEAAHDEPEIPAEHHEALVDWMLHLTYSTKDSEIEDQARAARHAGYFDDAFGPRPDADTLRRQRERRRVTTRYGGL